MATEWIVNEEIIEVLDWSPFDIIQDPNEDSEILIDTDSFEEDEQN